VIARQGSGFSRRRYKHYKRLATNGGQQDDDVELAKSNILLIGRRGPEDTARRKLARVLNVPFVIAMRRH